MIRWIRAALRCLYLSTASVLMLAGIVGLTEVDDVTGTLLGGSAELLSRYAVGSALLLMVAGMLMRMRGAHCLLGLLLLAGAGMSVHSLANFPSQDGDPAASAVFSPGFDRLVDTATAFTGAFLVLALGSPRIRRRLRSWIGARGRSALNHKGFTAAYLALAAACLSAGWAARLHLHRLIPLSDLPISSLERGAFNLTALGLLMFSLGVACKSRAAYATFVAALLVGVALPALSLFALPLSVPGSPIPFAPTPDELRDFLLRGTVSLIVLALLAPAWRRALRLCWQSLKRRIARRETIPG